jgi:meso-butanediol dehydrogenase / (S,S)-butanediol dehydrogenase / diacetyl reductase
VKLDGKVALVTGGGRGIGWGIALALAAEGADIAVIDTDLVDNEYNQYGVVEVGGYQAAQKVVGEIQGLGRKAIAIQADVTKWEQVEAMVQRTVEELGGIDISVHNAGVINVVSVEEMTEAAYELVMDVNVKGVFLCCKAVIPQMKKQGGGKIINTASIGGKNGFATLAHYCASKFAVVGFTNCLAKEVARDNITVNAICPGIVRTAMWDLLADLWKQPGETIEQSWQRHLEALIPQGRAQTPADMGALAVFFATNDNVTAQAFNIDGGTELH